MPRLRHRTVALAALLSITLSVAAGCGRALQSAAFGGLSTAPADTVASKDTRPDATGKLSFFTFFALDNDLDNGSIRLVHTLDRAASSSRNVVFVTQFDGADANDSIRHIGGGGLVEAQAKLGEINSGTAQSVADLMAFGGPKTEGTRRVISMADHGGGIVRGVLADWNAPGGKTIIHIKDLAPIFERTPVEIMMFDACFMSMAEVAYELKDGTRYLVAAQTTTRGDYPYGELARLLEGATATDSAQLAARLTRTIADNAWYEVSFGALDTKVVAQELAPKVKALAEAIMQALPARRADIQEAVKMGLSYGDFDDPRYELYNNFRDLGDIARNLSTIPDAALQKAARDVLRLCEDKRLNLAQFHRGARLDRATGVAVYAPVGPVTESYLTNNKWARDTKWGDAMVKLNGGASWAPVQKDKFPHAMPRKR